jgi:CubicO group peptidase (beta-lactamase class C family)
MAIARSCGRLGLVIAALSAALIGTTASAQAPLSDTPEAFGTVFKAWAARHRIERGFVAVRRGGRIVHRSAVGGANPNAPVHLASLSKAITGACVATLIRDGKLAFDTPMSVALKGFMARAGGFGDPRLARATVAELLTHRGGFGTRGQDPAIGPALVAYLKTHTARERPDPAFLASVLKHRLVNAPGATFGYSNAGYLALGAIIEEATGKRYAPFCNDAVLASLGLDAELEPSWRVMWSYGGWRLSAEHYLAFLDLFDVDDQRLGTVAKTWMLDPAGKTESERAEMWYGLGTFVRKAGRGVSVRHFGSWAYNTRGLEGLLRTSFLTFATRQSDGTAWLFHVSPRPPREDDGRSGPGLELERELLAAYRAVK